MILSDEVPSSPGEDSTAGVEAVQTFTCKCRATNRCTAAFK